MVNADWSALRHALVENYDVLRRRLTRRLRSSELAREALQDTYLRLEKGGALDPVDRPLAYILRIALNIAYDRQRAEKRHTAAAKVETALDIADDRPSPLQAAEAKSQLTALGRALEKLPARRRAIFVAAWVENLPREEIAKRFGLSTHRISVELAIAREHCAAFLKRSKGKK